ncbi:MAG: hypothetical protein KIT10_06295 [Flavobacteriales bacterium]|nr:hypothetical protein [Flavobacteriales bacterium]
MSRHWTYLALIASIATQAQWDVPVRLVLEGPEAGDRQVTGLADPQQRDAAVSLEAARVNVLTHASGTGSTGITAQLPVTPDTYVNGMVITLVPDTANVAGATLDLNGLGAVPILRRNGQQVQAGDLWAGAPVRLAFSDGAFRIISDMPTPCPPAFSVGGTHYCIADTSQAPVPFLQANLICDQQGARLCTFWEWVNRCLADPQFFNSVPDFEWVDHASNSGDQAKRLGYGSNGVNADPGQGCNYGGTQVHTNPSRFRCCKDR